jgi:dTDP-4-amino-4,6-dideoxygalactose transaminase
VAKSTLALPFHANMAPADVEYVAAALKMVVESALD